MSQVSHRGPRRLPSTKRKSLWFWWRKERPQFAHPWSAYSPETYLAGKAPKGIVMATKVHTLLEAAADTAPNACDKSIGANILLEDVPVTTAVEAKQSTPLLELIITPTPIASSEVAAMSLVAEPSAPNHAISQSEAHEQPTEPAVIIEYPATFTTSVASVLPIASGQNFQLAARLRSVSVLNRPVPAATGLVSGSAKQKRTGQNRPLRQESKSRRSRTIDPPAVLRKKRKSAEIIHLNLALARAEHRRTKAGNVA